MNILEINTVQNKGGAAKVAQRLKERLELLGHEVPMLVGEKGGGNNVHQIVRSRKNILRFNKFLGVESLFLHSTFGIPKMNMYINSDILHLHNLHGGYFNILALPEITRGKPTVWTLHDPWVIMEEGLTPEYKDIFRHHYFLGAIDTNPFLRKIKKSILQKADFTLVVPSKRLKNKIEKSFLSNKPVELIHHGVDHNIFKDRDKKIVRKELNLPLNNKILLFIAHAGLDNLTKGGDFLGEIYKNLDSNYRKNTIILIIGGAKKRIGNPDNFIFIPYIEDENLLSKYYAAADLFISPSSAESYSLVVLESLSCGTPVVAFDVGGIRELVESYKTGYLVPSGNVSELIKGINFFLGNERLLEQSSLEARYSIKKKFTIGVMVQKYLDLYNSLLC